MNEQEQRERRLQLAKQFAAEVATWSSEKLRRCYAQPEAVAAAERREAATEMTPGAIAELRQLPLHAPRPLFYYDPQERLWAALPELLDAAERCAAYDAKLTAVMPPDFKDWHENDKSEWPETAAWCITNWRERCAAAEAQAKAAGELLRAAKALLDESDIIQCDNPIVIPRFMDAIAAAERAGVKQ